jgi:hypothetical protein
VQLHVVLDLLGEAFRGDQLFAQRLHPRLSRGVEHGQPFLQTGPLVTFGGGEPIEQLQQVAHLLQGEPERPHLFHHAQPVEVELGVEPEPALAAGGRHDKAGVFVVADGADAQSDAFGGFADLHMPSGHQ